MKQNNIFTDTIFNRIPRNHFDLSFDRKFSCNMGELVPCYVQEVVPGDMFTIQAEHLIRFQPLVSPMMHRVRAYTHYFYVPNRILWEGWEDFIANPLDPANAAPFITCDLTAGDIGDYLGYPIGTGYNREFNAFPMAGFFKIFDDYYRDENLQTELFEPLIDGDNSGGNMLGWFEGSPLKRCWNHDYFTSALPFAQKGVPVSLPLGTSAPIDATSVVNFIDNQEQYVKNMAGANAAGTLEGASSPTGRLNTDLGGTKASAAIDVTDTLEVLTTGTADLSTATQITVNELRRSFRLQEWLEINARSGNRYIELIRAHFGVNSKDARLQRPEYIGGSCTNISISEVLQTSSTDEQTPQGNMAGHGIAVGGNAPARKYVEEHGFIIGIMSIMPESGYINPTPKWCTTLDPLEYLWPKFTELGEQEVYKYEVEGADTDAQSEEVFGYMPRYAQHRFNHSTVHGDFKTTLKHWHMNRDFGGNSPSLNDSFVQCVPTHRTFAVTTDTVDKCLVHMYHKIGAKRPLPRYNIPTT